MNAYGYVRVSTARQADKGLSLEGQEREIRRFCEERGLALCGMFRDEGVSAWSGKSRPGWERAIEAACLARGYLVVWRLDRASRNIGKQAQDVERLSRHGAALLTADGAINTETERASEKFLRVIMGGVAGLESDQKGERVTVALGEKLKKIDSGPVTGKAGFGWRRRPDGLGVEPVKDEQAHIMKIRKVLRGAKSLTAGIELLNETCETPREYRGGRRALWRYQTIKDLIVRNAMYREELGLEPLYWRIGGEEILGPEKWATTRQKARAGGPALRLK